MLRRYRRAWIALASALLILPLTIGVLAPKSVLLLPRERRKSTPMPDIPRSRADWIVLPRKLDAFLSDHFGLRREMIQLHAIIVHLGLRSGNARVLVGRDGWLFLRDNKMVQQSAGLLVRAARVFESADVIADIQATLAKRGIRFVFASPPNSTTIYPDRLLKWARNHGRRTEYDLMLEMLAKRGVKVVDLRPALRLERSRGPVYRKYDTHWTDRGALAGFNTIVTAAGHADWALNNSTVLGPPKPISGGDLADMLSIAGYVKEQTEMLTLPRGQVQFFSPEPFPTFLAELDSEKVSNIMVIGDSFTMHFFPPLVLANRGRFVWTRNLGCGFDWKWVEQFQPDEVWFMPTERFILCREGAENMPASDDAKR